MTILQTMVCVKETEREKENDYFRGKQGGREEGN